jgi:hypothetical protein
MVLLATVGGLPNNVNNFVRLSPSRTIHPPPRGYEGRFCFVGLCVQREDRPREEMLQEI